MIATPDLAKRLNISPQRVRARAKRLELEPRERYGVHFWNEFQAAKIAKKPERGRPRKGK